MRVEQFRKPVVVTRLQKKAPAAPAPARVGPVVAKPVAVAPTAPPAAAPTRPASITARPVAAPKRPIKPPLPAALETLNGWPLVGYANQEHVPLKSGLLGGVQFYRCRCGLLIAEHDHALFWVPVASEIERIETVERLGFVLGRKCWQSRAHAAMLQTFASEAEGG